MKEIFPQCDWSKICRTGTSEGLNYFLEASENATWPGEPREDPGSSSSRGLPETVAESQLNVKVQKYDEIR